MKLLIKIQLVQFFLYEKREVSIGQFTGVFGANGSGKSSLLDAVQIVMLGANQNCPLRTAFTSADQTSPLPPGNVPR